MAESKDARSWSYHITGRVFPERGYATVVMHDPLQIHLPNLDWEGWVHVSIDCAQISLIFVGPKPIHDFWTLKNTAAELAQNLVDALGYGLGCGYAVEITAISTPTGDHVVFGVNVPVLEASKAERPLATEDVLLLTLAHPWLRRALGELRGAIREPSDTGFHCQRAVESIRHHFQTNESVSEGWKAMRQALNVEEETLKSLREFGRPQRHGEMAPMTDAQRVRDMTLAWNIVDRFIVLLHRGLAQLSVEEFPPM